MLKKISPRLWNLMVFLFCTSLMAYALYTQYVDYLDPCPLCIFQRAAFIWMGVFALLAAIHNPKAVGRKIYAVLVFLGAAFGTAVAGRHVWMQHLPADQVPECGPGLNYMLDNFPLAEALASVFRGSGSCAEFTWTFLGMSMPEWALVWFIGLGLMTLWVSFRKQT